MLDPIMSVVASSKAPKCSTARASYLYSKLAELFSCVFIAGEEKDYKLSINPFWDEHSKKATDKVKDYSAALVVNDLYVVLKDILESNGFVVETPKSHGIQEDCFHKIPYYYGTSYVFIPRS